MILEILKLISLILAITMSIWNFKEYKDSINYTYINITMIEILLQALGIGGFIYLQFLI